MTSPVRQCDQVLEKKEAQMFLKVAQIVAASVYTYSNFFVKIAKKSHNFLVTFITKLVVKIFQKLPNQVTLPGSINQMGIFITRDVQEVRS